MYAIELVACSPIDHSTGSIRERQSPRQHAIISPPAKRGGGQGESKKWRPAPSSLL